MTRLAPTVAALLLSAPSLAQTATPTISAVRAATVGTWTGQLEYRDYQADRWFGLPVKVEIRDGGDGVTLIRVADFDDGPQTGIVRITTVAMLGKDGMTEYAASFRKAKVPELETATLALAAARDTAHWTLVATIKGSDDDRPATIRETTVRDGATMTTVKEVDYADDAKTEWLVRNRTTLTRG